MKSDTLSNPSSSETILKAVKPLTLALQMRFF